MKKKISIIFCLCLAVLALFALCSCDCKHEWGEGTVITAPTCESEGATQFTCSKCLETKTETTARVNHAMKPYEWEWAEDLSSASALMCCSYNVHHTTYADAEVTFEVKVEQTCGEEGIMITTATLTYDGNEYKTSREDAIAPTLLHEDLTEKTINLADYGACAGTLKYNECGKCKSKLFSDGCLTTSCTFDTPLSTVNGISTHKCTACSLVLDYTRAFSETLPCKESGVIGISLKTDSASIITNVFYSVERTLCADFARPTVLDLNILTGNTSCTKEISVLQCEHCEALTGFDGEYVILCGGGVLPEPRDVIASDGTEIKRYEIHCDDCELRFIIDEYYKDGVFHKDMQIFDGNELAYEIKS